MFNMLYYLKLAINITSNVLSTSIFYDFSDLIALVVLFWHLKTLPNALYPGFLLSRFTKRRMKM